MNITKLIIKSLLCMALLIGETKLVLQNKMFKLFLHNFFTDFLAIPVIQDR